MKTSLILFGAFLFNNFPAHYSLNTPLVYTEITDCGDGKYGNFVASITPNPIIWVGNLDSTFWVGVRASCTKEAKILLSNTSARDFDSDLRGYFIIDEHWWASIPSDLKSQLEKVNNTNVCGNLILHELCPTFLQGVLSSLTNVTLFNSFDLGLNQVALIRNIVDLTLGIAEIEIKLQVGITLYGETLVCVRFLIKLAPFDDTIGSTTDDIRNNVQRVFETPKIINFFNENEILSCPENSTEINNSSCECSYPFSGPVCSFHCRYDEIHESFCPSADESTFACTFRNEDYIAHCIKDKNVQFLNGSVAVDSVSLNHINIKWKLVHFLAMYKYELTLQDNGGSLIGRITTNALNLNGLESSYSLVSLCLNDIVYGIDCRYTNSDHETCFNCPDLSLNPFHEYTVVLKLGVGQTNDRMSNLLEYVTTAVNFTTPEVGVIAPKITSAALDGDQNFISVDWMINDKWCPGYIRRYELIVSCNSDQIVSSGNLSFDCRSSSQGPKLNTTVPGNCKRENIYIKLRIGTANSTSDESEQFLLEYRAWSTLIIIAYVLGASLIAVAIASVIFFYFYKRHVKSFQNAHQAVRKLLHIQRKSGVGQSFRARTAPNLPIPDVPQSCNSPADTAYQTIFTTSEVGSPHSLQVPEKQNETVSPTPCDSLGYKFIEIQLETASTTPRDSLDYKII